MLHPTAVPAPGITTVPTIIPVKQPWQPPAAAPAPPPNTPPEAAAAAAPPAASLPTQSRFDLLCSIVDSFAMGNYN